MLGQYAVEINGKPNQFSIEHSPNYSRGAPSLRSAPESQVRIVGPTVTRHVRCVPRCTFGVGRGRLNQDLAYLALRFRLCQPKSDLVGAEALNILPGEGCALLAEQAF